MAVFGRHIPFLNSEQEFIDPAIMKANVAVAEVVEALHLRK